MNNNFKIVLFYCQNCVSDDRDINVAAAKAIGFTVKPVLVPCSSKIQVHNIMKILDKEADAIEIVACPEDNCRFLVGSARTKKRVEYVHTLLDEIGVNPACVGITQKAVLSSDDLIELSEKRFNAVRGRE